MSRITALVPCFNNESSICRTLQAVSWSDEILVVDSYSTDRTVELAINFGARVIQHGYENSATQKNWALQFCSHPWVFQIDTDEVLELGLEGEIKNAVLRADPHV